MSDLISRQAAIDALESIGSLDTEADKKYARSVFEALPAAQPERKTGKWIKARYVLTSNPAQYVWNCSECGKSVNGYSAVVLTDYCPDCGSYNGGAKMEGEKDG